MNEKIICGYDENEIYNAELEYRLETPKEYIPEYYNMKKMTKDQITETIKENLNQDSDIYQLHYDGFLETLQEEINKIHKTGFYWKAKGKNLNWLAREGTKVFQAETSEELLKAILSDANDRTIEIKSKGKNILHITEYHHDCPTGSQYYIKPITEKTFQKEND